MQAPDIVYFQTRTICNGHCVYCPFDDIYKCAEDNHLMSEEMFRGVIGQLREEWWYQGRVGFLLHYEPTLDNRLPEFFKIIRKELPYVRIEVATNGLLPNAEILKLADIVQRVPPNSLNCATARAGNARACQANESRATFPQPCELPLETMCIAANGDILLCCMDWRHEAVIGNASDIVSARIRQLELHPHVLDLKLQICRDCAAGKTAEEVEGLGSRKLKLLEPV